MALAISTFILLFPSQIFIIKTISMRYVHIFYISSCTRTRPYKTDWLSSQILKYWIKKKFLSIGVRHICDRLIYKTSTVILYLSWEETMKADGNLYKTYVVLNDRINNWWRIRDSDKVNLKNSHRRSAALSRAYSELSSRSLRFVSYWANSCRSVKEKT